MLNIFESAVTPALAATKERKRVRLSPAERLYRDVQAHREQQVAVLTETERARGLSATPLAKFLLKLIEDGSAKDLETLDRMGASLRDALYWTHSPDALPEATDDRERAAAVESIRQVLRLERERAQSARRLAKSYAGINGGLERALLEASAATSESNVRLLRLLLDRIEHGVKEQPAVSTVWQPALRQRTVAFRQRQSRGGNGRSRIAA